ncbi:hypothetical protein Cgig2_020208 [Carnegiea gigantea]|uniref:Tryptophan/tyrosine permease n=1 Tax=Carnegiea gigantea TaxID=171969 RepID=A0A9Q1QR29_9CARY|nr:hypothetical protein Cgig2_020208 [Carnegiea gigantea]
MIDRGINIVAEWTSSCRQQQRGVTLQRLYPPQGTLCRMLVRWCLLLFDLHKILLNKGYSTLRCYVLLLFCGMQSNVLLHFTETFYCTSFQVVASGDLHWEALLKANFEAVPSSIPVIALAFVYQNVVPVLCTNLEGDLSKVRTAIILGTAIPLLLFLVWNGVILGTITNVDSDVQKIVDPLEQLRSSNGLVGPIVEIFSLLAIGTSYIGFVLGLADFIADLLNLPTGQSKSLPYLITLLPPLVLALLDPEIFFKALDFAGTYGVLVLFGILPAAMTWSDRYSTSPEFPKVGPLVPGGKLTLSLVIGGASWVILSELINDLSHT